MSDKIKRTYYLESWIVEAIEHYHRVDRRRKNDEVNVLLAEAIAHRRAIDSMGEEGGANGQ